MNDEYRNGTITKYPSAPWSPANVVTPAQQSPATIANVQPANNPNAPASIASEGVAWGNASNGWYEPTKSALALVGLVAIALRLVKVVR